MDAITMLKTDHDKVKQLLTELESTTERGVKTRAELFSTIKGELTVHEIIEEEIFYPALKSHPKAKDIVLEAFEEHHVVDLLMSELEELDVTDETWGAKAIVMKENIEHHIEEEEGEMFRQARRVFDRQELDDLGERMSARKASAQLHCATRFQIDWVRQHTTDVRRQVVPRLAAKRLRKRVAPLRDVAAHDAATRR